MRRSVTYRLEPGDPRCLSPKRIFEIEHLLRDAITDEDRGITTSREGDSNRNTPKATPAPGLKAMGLIKGNMPFETADIRAMAAYVEELCGRMEARRETVIAERNSQERDAHSLKAYDYLIGSMQDCVSEVRRIMRDFEDEFHRMISDGEDLQPGEIYDRPAQPSPAMR